MLALSWHTLSYPNRNPNLNPNANPKPQPYTQPQTPTPTLTLTLTLTRYTLSYVPYGQAAARSLLRRALKRAGVELPAGATASTGRVAPAGLAAVAEAGEGS